MEVGTFKADITACLDTEKIGQRCYQLQRPMVSKKHQIIGTYLDGSLPVIKADPDRLRQVIMNFDY
jgi:signal transduction histidine kinase